MAYLLLRYNGQILWRAPAGQPDEHGRYTVGLLSGTEPIRLKPGELAEHDSVLVEVVGDAQTIPPANHLHANSAVHPADSPLPASGAAGYTAISPDACSDPYTHTLSQSRPPTDTSDESLQPVAGHVPAQPPPQPPAISFAGPRQPVPTVSGYQILAPLGQGGMGTVWRAIQNSTRRPVALKIMRTGLLSSPNRIRFQFEVEVTARLNHPGIARLYESRVDGEQFCYAMELVEGVDLRRFVQTTQPGDRTIIALIVEVCRAVQYAHQRGVLHRDIKPGNIMVCPQTEHESPLPPSHPAASSNVGLSLRPRPANTGSSAVNNALHTPQIKVLDFGLAKLLANADANVSQEPQTREGAAVGTPGYMSPEQAAGNGDDVDTRSDVYALGLVLYEMLLGEHPHGRGSPIEMIYRISTQPIRPPRSIRPSINPDLEAILIKALARSPEQRYPSAAELADDLERFLEHEPVRAQRQTTWYLLRKRAAKHRGKLTAAAAIFAVFLAGAALSVAEIDHQRHNALLASQEARAQQAAAQTAAMLAELQRDRAEEAAARAEQNHQRAEDAAARARTNANAMRDTALNIISSITPKLRGTPGAADVMVQLARTSHDLLTGIINTDVTAELRLEVLAANVHIADALGAPQAVNLGRTAEARRIYEQAVQMARDLPPGQQPHDLSRLALALPRHRLADLLRATGQLDDAEQLYLEALNIIDSVAQQWSEEAQVYEDLATIHLCLFDLYLDKRQLDKAQAHLLNMAAAVDQLASRSADHPSAQPLRALLAARQARLALVRNRLDEARSAAARSLQIQQALADQNPDDLLVQLRLLDAICIVADIALRTAAPPAAAGAFRRAIQFAENLRQAPQADRLVDRKLIEALDRLGDLLVPADPASEELLGIRERQLHITRLELERLPDADDSRLNLTIALNKLGDVHRHRQDFATASTLYAEQLVHARQRKQLIGDAADETLKLAIGRLGLAYLGLDQIDSAKAAFAEHEQLAARCAQRTPRNPSARRDLAISHYNWARLHFRLYHLAEADPHAQIEHLQAAEKCVRNAIDAFQAMLEEGLISPSDRANLAGLRDEARRCRELIEQLHAQLNTPGP